LAAKLAIGDRAKTPSVRNRAILFMKYLHREALIADKLNIITNLS
jgi:hypothetical protein